MDAQFLFRHLYHSYIALTIGIVISFVIMLPFLRSSMIQLRLIAFIGLLYPVGKVLQFTRFGDVWVRSYLADFGFTCGLGLVLFGWHLSARYKSVHDRTERRFILQASIISAIIVTFFIAVLAESVQLYANEMMMQKMNKMMSWSARGDWMDLIVYFVSSAIGILAALSIPVYPRLQRT